MNNLKDKLKNADFSREFNGLNEAEVKALLDLALNEIINLEEKNKLLNQKLENEYKNFQQELVNKEKEITQLKESLQ